MASAAPTDVREWLRRQHPDQAISERGKIRADWQAEYDAAHPDGPPEGDYSGVTEADFPPDDAQERVAESKPRRVRGTRTPAARAGTGWRWGRRDGKPKAPRKKLPRVPVDRLIEHFWGQLAWAASPVPPLEKMLYAQAPFAGTVLDDVVRGTIIDGPLQVAARMEEKFQALNGLLGPPVCIMLALANAPAPCQACGGRGGVLAAPNGQAEPQPVPCPQCEGTGAEPASAIYAGAMGGLRFSLMSMTDAIGDGMERVMERAAENKRKARQVDAFIEWLFEMPRDGDVEEEAVARVGQMVGAE
jgi:hypothetical protein